MGAQGWMVPAWTQKPIRPLTRQGTLLIGPLRISMSHLSQTGMLRRILVIVFL
ncbi:hypothetical protein BDW68DRAFT_152620, partial [Aspergillus falconensis]